MITLKTLTGGRKIMNMAKLGTVSRSLTIWATLEIMRKYKELRLMPYTLCEVPKIETRNVSWNCWLPRKHALPDFAHELIPICCLRKMLIHYIIDKNNQQKLFAYSMRLPILCIIFLLSGAAGLLFETLWFRGAGLTFGNSVWASAITLAAYMGGLALGNIIAWRFGRRIRQPIHTYAILELIIAVVGLLLVPLLPAMANVLPPAWFGGRQFLVDFSDPFALCLRVPDDSHHCHGSHTPHSGDGALPGKHLFRQSARLSLRLQHTRRNGRRNCWRGVPD